MKRRVFLAAFYLIPFAMVYGAILLSDRYGAIGIVIGFAAGVVYAAIRNLEAGEDRG